MQMRILVGIVTYNSHSHIEACLRSLAAQTLQPEAIRILDNASLDGTREFIRNLSIDGLASLDLEGSGVNLGFGNAHNHILAHTDCTHYLMLSPDTTLEPEFLEQAAHSLEEHRTAVVNGMVHYWNDGVPSSYLYSCGHVLYRDRRIEDVGNGVHVKSKEWEACPLFGANGVGVLFEIAALRDVAYPEGPFDGAYFVAGEHEDLNWRLALAGHQTWFEPKAVMHYDALAAGRSRIEHFRRNALANHWLTLVKNDHAKLFKHDLLWFVPLELVYWLMRAVRRPRFVLELVGAFARFLKLLPYALRRRRITPIRISFAQESALAKSDMGTRVRMLWARYTHLRRA